MRIDTTMKTTRRAHRLCTVALSCSSVVTVTISCLGECDAAVVDARFLCKDETTQVSARRFTATWRAERSIAVIAEAKCTFCPLRWQIAEKRVEESLATSINDRERSGRRCNVTKRVCEHDFRDGR